MALAGVNWRNEGTIEAAGGTVNVGGTVQSEDLGTVLNTAGTLRLQGTVENAGRTWDLGRGGNARNWQIAGGRDNGGEISSSTAAQLSVSSATMDNVTLDVDTILRRLFWEEKLLRFEPQAAVGQVEAAAFLQLPLPEDALRTQARRLAASHSKASSRPYDARVRDQEHLLLRTTYAQEVSHAMHWAERHLLPFLPAETHSVDA